MKKHTHDSILTRIALIHNKMDEIRNEIDGSENEIIKLTNQNKIGSDNYKWWLNMYEQKTFTYEMYMRELEFLKTLLEGDEK